MADKKQFILYDGRAKSGDTDDAAVMDSANSERDAIRASRKWRGVDCIWYEYDDINGALENETPRWDIE